MGTKLQPNLSEVKSKIVPLRGQAPEKGVCAILSDTQGINARPGQSKIQCPFCGHRTLAIKGDDGLAKCFHPSCGRHITPWHTEHRTGLYAIHDEIFQACRQALLEQRDKDGTVWKYLVEERRIYPEVVETASLGVVPSEFGSVIDGLFDPLIAETEKAVSTKKAGRPTNKEAVAQVQLRTLREAMEKALTCFENRRGWLCLFYRDEHHRILSIKLREPYTKHFVLYKPFPRCGVFGADVFSLFESEKYQEENRLFVVEGDFNALALWSAELRYAEKAGTEKRFHHACAVGGVDAADLATVRAIGSRPLFIYDHDDAGFGLLDKARESMHADGTTTPGADSDMDSFIRSFGSDVDAAWNGVKKVIADRKAYPRTFDSVAAEIYAVRQKQEGPDRRRDFEINSDVAAIILNDLSARGQFYRSPIGPHFLSDETKKLIPLDKGSPDLVLLLHQYGLNSSEPIFRFVAGHLEAEGQQNGTETDIHSFSHFDPDTYTLYITNHAGQIYRITDSAITRVENGTDGVLFLDDPKAEPFEYDPSLLRENHRPLHNLLISRISFADDSCLTRREGETIFTLWLYSLFFGSLIKTSVLLVFKGPKRSRKTAVARQAGQLLYGKHFNVTPNPEERDDFETLLTNSAFIVLDNVDTAERWLDDLLAVVATRGTIPRRRLYSTNTLVQYPIECSLVITCRTPPFGRDDVCDRCLLLLTQTQELCSTESDLQTELLENRNAMMTELLNDLQGVVVALKNTKTFPRVTNFRMADFGVFCLRIAKAQNQDAQVRQILDKLTMEQSRFNLEGDQALIEILLRWADTGVNSTRYLTNNELHAELAKFCKEYGITFEYEDPKKLKGFTTKMGLLRGSMGKLHFDIREKNLGHNRRAYCYAPKSTEKG